MSGADDLARGRARSVEAARWLRLIRYQNHASAPVFSAAISTYADMLDPASTDARRLAACRSMLAGVLRQAAQERLAGEAVHAQDRPVDPYGLEWRITLQGAVLEAIARLLRDAVAAFEAAQVEG
ncbi:hypothetical protein [uncultured Jannaschia sp.]|uniref:hypothetical protein n=1 Tax=uncultured Jannaschia sp. TaxID=293347 RepID=UPI0026222AC3|nr:hypothetical protein [uncultured Jannaschia sp.]